MFWGRDHFYGVRGAVLTISIYLPYSSMSNLKSSPESNCLQGGPGAAVTLCRVTGTGAVNLPEKGLQLLLTALLRATVGGAKYVGKFHIAFFEIFQFLKLMHTLTLVGRFCLSILSCMCHLPQKIYGRGLHHLDSQLPDALNFNKNNSLPDDIFSKLKYFLKMSNYFRFVAPGVCNKMSFSVIK